jgi:N-acetylglutamate synthase-like GNAT family acetyltransferase
VIRDASAADLDTIRELLSRANDTDYDLERVAEEKCFGRGFSGEPTVRLHDDNGIAVTCGRYLRLLAVDPAKRGCGIGTLLLRDAESRGVRIIGAEAGNYFVPGVPEDLIGFFREYKETARTNNLIASTAFESPSSVRRATHAEKDRVLDFIAEHFGAIWRFEAARAFETDEPTLMVAERDNTLIGFAAHEANNRGLGTFGPTGVAKAFRGRGVGRDLLLASLADLRRLGYAQAIIPWTDAIEFYRRACNAVVTGTFVTLASTR